MALVEDHPRRRTLALASACGVDHHQRVVGDDDVGILGGAGRAFDEAFAPVRAASIDALAAPVGQRGCACSAEQRRQPAGQIAADHVAITAICRPACRQPRKDRRASGKATLQRILQIEQTQVILPPLAHCHLGAMGCLVGVKPPRFARELALQVLGEGRDMHGAARCRAPFARRGEIGERLANARARLGQQHRRPAFAVARGEDGGCSLGHGALTRALLGTMASQLGQAQRGGFWWYADRARLRARVALFPFGQAGEQAGFALGRGLEPRCHRCCPRPA